jgi:hypothetical protein
MPTLRGIRIDLDGKINTSNRSTQTLVASWHRWKNSQGVSVAEIDSHTPLDKTNTLVSQIAYKEILYRKCISRVELRTFLAPAPAPDRHSMWRNCGIVFDNPPWDSGSWDFAGIRLVFYSLGHNLMLISLEVLWEFHQRGLSYIRKYWGLGFRKTEKANFLLPSRVLRREHRGDVNHDSSTTD